MRNYQIVMLTIMLTNVFASLDLFSSKNEKFYLSEYDFVLNNKKFQIISGEMHYPRIPKEAWGSRMKMAKAMGLNTISTYVFWNMHQPESDVFDFENNNNIREFINEAKKENLYVILRPSPYVCAEWDFGGYPYWLLTKNVEVRSKNKVYLEYYTNYINKIGEQLSDLQINKGGNIILIQLENEYGSYGSDKEYLNINRTIFRNAGFDGILITCDPENAIKNGSLKGVLPAINGVDDPNKVFELITENNNWKGPFLIAEWYPAWYDIWGMEHHVKDTIEYSHRLENVLKNGISINMYMFHGGTNFNFHNGANFNLWHGETRVYEPEITSYDYDAPLDEAGNPTKKYFAFREVIKKYVDYDIPEVPLPKKAIELKGINWYEHLDILQKLKSFKSQKGLLSFEEIGLDYGYMIYETTLKIESNNVNNIDINEADIEYTIFIKDSVRDYAHFYLNDVYIGKMDRTKNDEVLKFKLSDQKEYNLKILVENLGRINFGEMLLENKKGIIGDIILNDKLVENWTSYKVGLKDLANLKTSNSYSNLNNRLLENPYLSKCKFKLNEIGDTYIDLTNYGKGTIWINNYNLGRYWNIGPQQTLYIPVEYLRIGDNELLIFEFLKNDQVKLDLIDKPILDKLKNN